MENNELSKKIKNSLQREKNRVFLKNSLQKIELMIENKECALKINEEKEKLNLLLEEYYQNMK